jgi:hypothetical protein
MHYKTPLSHNGYLKSLEIYENYITLSCLEKIHRYVAAPLFFIRPLSHTHHPLPANTSRTITCLSSQSHFSLVRCTRLFVIHFIGGSNHHHPLPANTSRTTSCLSSLLASLLTGQMHETLCHPFYHRNRPHHPLPANTSRKTTYLSLSLTSLWSDAPDSFSSI